MKRRYPVGIQTFSEIREKGYVYVDKTAIVYKVANDASKYVFLSRPRRFGKSLLVSTFKSYFEGRKDLFEGLKMAELETEWEQYTVLHFDMSTAKHCTEENLEIEIAAKLDRYEKIYGRNASHINLNQRLEGLIISAYEQTGKQVVVLIDEYDAPLLDVIHEDTDLPKLRQIMRNFYSPLKACDPYLRFVFITGITKFSQLSVFSELNNISNISMLDRYSAICGITAEELKSEMRPEVEALAESLELSYEETMEKLKSNYDGYHFSAKSPDIFNPYSLLNAINNEVIDSYWFGSGTPTYLIEMLHKFDVAPSEIGPKDADASDFDAPIERMTSILPLLYQSGYITIKDYDAELDNYTLDIPNKEVRLGLMRSLIPYYVVPDPNKVTSAAKNMMRCLYNDDMDGTLSILKEFLAIVPYCDNANSEGHYQQMFYIIFSLLGNYVDVETRTNKGRVDVVMRTATKLYVIELKLNKNAETAMKQIEQKDYAARFSQYNLPIIKVGINFSKEKHNIDGWVIAEAGLK